MSQAESSRRQLVWIEYSPYAFCFGRIVSKQNFQIKHMNSRASVVPNYLSRFSHPLFPFIRRMDTPAGARLSNRINAHLSSSKVISPDKMPRAVSKFITYHPWSIQHKPGSSFMSMHNTVDARSIDIRWDLINGSSGGFLKV